MTLANKAGQLYTVKAIVSTWERRENMSRILIADDDPDYVLICRRILEAEGYEVLEAANGTQTLEMMHKEKPDLLLLDVMMATTLEGVDISKELDSDPELKDIPVVMISSIATTEYAPEFPEERIPIEAWISKPVQPAVLLGTVRRFLKSVYPPEEVAPDDSEIAQPAD
jgi:CheY-like chemotaxis protein